MIKQNIYEFFAGIVFKKTGIHYAEKDFYRLDSRINALMADYDCETADDLYNLFLQNTTPEMEIRLIDLCTNNETYFFRDQRPFEALANDMVPELLQHNSNKMLNIWSCACSTGQEPISILIGIKEKHPELFNRIHLEATDISQQALSKAKLGVYSSLEVQRGLPITLLMKYFENNESENTWQVNSQIHSKIHFQYFNLLGGLYSKNKYDIIFCRNVLIYQNIQNKAQILELLSQSLKPGGYLIMGAGESLIGSKVSLEQKSYSGAMVFYKPALEELKKSA